MDSERRVLEGLPLQVETRSIGGKNTKVITGYAIKYNVRSQLLGFFYEEIDSRALEGADVSDVVALFNHDPNIVLGRTTAGTLKLENRSDGLFYTIYPPASAAYVVESIERGDVKGSSFGFTEKEKGSEWKDGEKGIMHRTVKHIAKLFDVSPTTYPAYLQSSSEVAKRSLEAYQQEKAIKNSLIEYQLKQLKLFI